CPSPVPRPRRNCRLPARSLSRKSRGCWLEGHGASLRHRRSDVGSVVAVIPARGGSKRIPRKNMAPCAGKPLIVHTFAAAKASQRLNRILLSTEDPEIAACGRDNGIEVHPRPPALAADDTPMLAVLENIMAWLDHPESDGPESFVLLQ